METRHIGVILNGVTGRMGTNQHLARSIKAIVDQGGIKVNDDLTLMPDPILTGRNENKLKRLSEMYGVEKYTTDLDQPLQDPRYEIFFDSSGTQQRKGFVERAVKTKKSIYCEKPTAMTTEDGVYLAKICEDAGLKNGVVQDKLWLPGLRKFRMVRDQGFLGRVLSVKGDFGYWVFAGDIDDQPTQRPSWNYRREDGGGMVLDMHCHWQYLISNLFGEIRGVSCRTATLMDKRFDEQGQEYSCTADDTAYATFELEDGSHVQFVSSWNTRVRRDELLQIQVDGTAGSAVFGLRHCFIQPHAATPKAVWNPDIPNPINFYDQWQEVPDAAVYENAFKVQWEMFLRHHALDEPFRWTLREGAKGIQLAELSLRSHEQRAWVDVPDLG